MRELFFRFHTYNDSYRQIVGDFFKKFYFIFSNTARISSPAAPSEFDS